MSNKLTFVLIGLLCLTSTALARRHRHHHKNSAALPSEHVVLKEHADVTSEDDFSFGNLFDEDWNTVYGAEPTVANSVDEPTMKKSVDEAVEVINKDAQVEVEAPKTVISEPAAEPISTEVISEPVSESVHADVISEPAQESISEETVEASPAIPDAPALPAQPLTKAPAHVSSGSASFADELAAKSAEHQARLDAKAAHASHHADLSAELAAKVAAKQAKAEAAKEASKEANEAKAARASHHDALMAELHAKFEARRKTDLEKAIEAEKTKRASSHAQFSAELATKVAERQARLDAKAAHALNFADLSEELAVKVAAKQAKAEAAKEASKEETEFKAARASHHDALMADIRAAARARAAKRDAELHANAHKLVMAELVKASKAKHNETQVPDEVEIASEMVPTASLEKSATELLEASSTAAIHNMSHVDLITLDKAVQNLLLAAAENEEANKLVKGILAEKPRLEALYNQLKAMNAEDSTATIEEKKAISDEFLEMIKAIIAAHEDKFPKLFEELAAYCVQQSSNDSPAVESAFEAVEQHVLTVVDADQAVVERLEKEVGVLHAEVGAQLAILTEEEQEAAAAKAKEAAIKHKEAEKNELIDEVRKVEADVTQVSTKVDAISGHPSTSANESSNPAIAAAGATSTSTQSTEEVPIAMIAGIVGGVALLAAVVGTIFVVRKKNAARRAGEMETPVGV